jgi:hypothetical protein
MNLRWMAVPLSLLLVSAQEFKEARLVEKERYVYGLPVSVKKGSRFSKLNLVPGGWELWIVEANGARPFQFGDMDQPNPTIVQKAQACTRLHEALSSDKGSMNLTIVVRRPGNSRGILVKVAIEEWDQGFEYIWRKWRQDPSLIILPLASTQVGTESYTARVDYTEQERLAEVAEYELKKGEEAAEKKGTPLKSRESFQLTQRRLRLDAGLQKAEKADDAYLAARRAKGQDLYRQAQDRAEKKEWFDAHRFARAAAVFDAGAAGIVDRVKSALAPLGPEDRGKLKKKTLTQALAEGRENPVRAAEGAAFCLLLNPDDKEAAKILDQTRVKAFGAKEMAKEDLDRWIGVLGPLTDLPVAKDLKEDVVYRVTGKVMRAGPFTLVESAKAGKWVFEDKAGIKFEEGDSFILVATFEPGKPPGSMPEDLKEHPFLRVIAVR